MTPGEINNLVTLLVAVLAPVAAKYGINDEQTATLIGSMASAGAIIWGVISHWGKIKAPADSIVLPPVKPPQTGS